MPAGLVFAFDLGIRSGFAFGRPGEIPRSGVIALKKPAEHRAVAFSNFIAFVDEKFRELSPALVVKEEWWGMGAAVDNSSGPVVYVHVGLHAIVEGMCGRYGVPWREAGARTIRKHFLGRADVGPPRVRGTKRTSREKAEARNATKEAVKARCRLLKILPPEFDNEDNVADALATHDWGCATYGKQSVSTSELHFFGEEAAHG